MTWDLLGQLFTAQLSLWWIIWPGILLGIVVGFLPGFNAENTLIMLLPLTLAMPVDHALAFMTSLYCATHLGGGIPAILVRIPGTPGAAATTLDGYPLTQQGRGQFALVLSFVASVFCGLIACIVTVAMLPFLSSMGMHLRSVEMVVVMLFSLALIGLYPHRRALVPRTTGAMPKSHPVPAAKPAEAAQPVPAGSEKHAAELQEPAEKES
jgi:putative tricarboxylic transport membrane protein